MQLMIHTKARSTSDVYHYNFSNIQIYFFRLPGIIYKCYVEKVNDSSSIHEFVSIICSSIFNQLLKEIHYTNTTLRLIHRLVEKNK